MEDTKHSAAQVLPPRAHQTRTAAGCGTRHCCILYTLSIAVRNLTAQSCSKAQLARRARAVQQSPPRRTRVRVKRHRRDATRPHCCDRETPSTRHAVAASGTPSENVKRIDRARRRRERNAVGNDVRKLQQLRRRELVAAAVAAECWSLRGPPLGALALPGALGGDGRVLRLDRFI